MRLRLWLVVLGAPSIVWLAGCDDGASTIAEGGACMDDDECMPMLVCRATASDPTERCTGPVGEGERCHGWGGIAAWECAEGLGCATAFNSEIGGTCRPWAQEGEACGGDPAMVLPLCESALYCADSSGASTHLTGTCVPRLAIGEQCYRARYWHAPCLNAALCPQDDDAGVCPAP